MVKFAKVFAEFWWVGLVVVFVTIGIVAMSGRLFLAGGAIQSTPDSFEAVSDNCAHIVVVGVDYADDADHVGYQQNVGADIHWYWTYISAFQKSWAGARFVEPSKCTLLSVQDGDVSHSDCVLNGLGVLDWAAVPPSCVCSFVDAVPSTRYNGVRAAKFQFDYWVSKDGTSCVVQPPQLCGNGVCDSSESITSCPSDCVTPPDCDFSCVDSDGGKNFGAKGSVTITSESCQTSTEDDVCANSQVLNEKFCGEQLGGGVGIVTAIESCEDGCDLGACKGVIPWVTILCVIGLGVLLAVVVVVGLRKVRK